MSETVDFSQRLCQSCLRPPGGHRRRGLCPSCYNRHSRRGTLDIFGRTSMPTSLLLDEYAMLRNVGVRPRYMPERLGMSREAFERAMFRARRAGDPRAQTWKGLAA